MSDSRRKVLQLIWMVFLIMPGAHWFALQVVLRDPEFSALYELDSPLAFQIAGALVAVAVLVAWRMLLSPEALGKTGQTSEARLRSWMVRHIALYVGVDTLSMLGLVVGVLCHSTRHAPAFFGLAVFMTAVLFPNAGPLDEADDAQKKDAFRSGRRPSDSKLG